MNRRSFFATLFALPVLARLRPPQRWRQYLIGHPIEFQPTRSMPMASGPTTIALADGTRVTLRDWLDQPMYSIPQRKLS